MAYIILPQRWWRQPTQPTGVNWSHPSAAGLAEAISAQWPGVNFVGTPNTPTALEFAPKKIGLCVTAATTSGGISQTVPVSGDRTIAFYAIPVSSLPGVKVFFTTSTTSGVAYWIGIYQAGAEAWWSIGGNGIRSADLLVGGSTDFVVVTKSGSTHTLYVNGVQKAQSTNSLADGANGSTWLRYGSDTGNTVTASVSHLGMMARWTRALGAGEITELSVNPWQIFKPITRRIYVPSAGTGAVNVNLTGLAATGAVGSLAKSASKALTGLAATGAVGTLVPSTGYIVALTGLAATGAVGSLSKSASVALSGLAATAAVGSFAAKATVAVSGLAATGAVGSIAASYRLTLTGQAATGAVGSLSPSTVGQVGLTGLAATGAVGTLAPSVNVTVSGLAATAAVGSLAASAGTNVSLTGLAATAAVGEFSASASVALTGLGATAAVGSLSVPSSEQAEESATGGWLRARRIRQLDELSKLPTKEEIQAERERLGILPKKAQRAVEKVAERELSSAAADDDSLEQAIREFVSGSLQERAERAVRNELAAKGQPYRREVPGVLRAILADGLRRAAEAEIRQQQRAAAAVQEEAEVQELLSIWIDM